MHRACVDVQKQSLRGIEGCFFFENPPHATERFIAGNHIPRCGDNVGRKRNRMQRCENQWLRDCAESVDGKAVDWMEHVTDQQYLRAHLTGEQV